MEHLFPRIGLYFIYATLFFTSLFSSAPDKWVGVALSVLFFFLSHRATRAKPASSEKRARV